MLVDLRYHVITIVIIFVTLAIGILIGSSMVGNELIIKEQQKIITKLEEDFIYLRNENRNFAREVSSLEAKLADNIKFQKMIMPLVVKGQLSKESLLVVVGEDINAEMEDRVTEALKLANVENLIIKKASELEQDDLTEEFNKVLFLEGSRDELKTYDLNLDPIKVKANSLSNISSLIKLVLKISTDNLSGE